MISANLFLAGMYLHLVCSIAFPAADVLDTVYLLKRDKTPDKKGGNLTW